MYRAVRKFFRVILRNKRKWRLQGRLDNWLFVWMHWSIAAASTEWPQGIRKITRISDVVLPFLVAQGRKLNSVCTNELKMAKAVVNEFINKVEVNTFFENGVRFSVTVRVSPNRFTNSLPLVTLIQALELNEVRKLTSVNSSCKLDTYNNYCVSTK